MSKLEKKRTWVVSNSYQIDLVWAASVEEAIIEAIEHNELSNDTNFWAIELTDVPQYTATEASYTVVRIFSD